MSTAALSAFSGIVLSPSIDIYVFPRTRASERSVIDGPPPRASWGEHFHSSTRLQAQDKIAVPYANGMLELAQERDNLDEVHKDLMTLQVRPSSTESTAPGRRVYRTLDRVYMSIHDVLRTF